VLQNMMREGFSSGAVRPLNRTVFPNMEVEHAFRCACYERNITGMTEQNWHRLLSCCVAFQCYIFMKEYLPPSVLCFIVLIFWEGFKKLNLLIAHCLYIYALMLFAVKNRHIYQTSISVHG
jgi:hypothetical protein